MWKCDSQLRDTSDDSWMQLPAPETLTTGNATTYIVLAFILNFAAESYARDPNLFWTKMDAATCARDVYHEEHRGVACTDFHLKLQCGKLSMVIVFVFLKTAAQLHASSRP